VELKRRERLRVGWTVLLGVLGILLFSIGTAKAGSKTSPAQIKRAVELRVAVRKCDEVFKELREAKSSVKQSEAAKACASLLLEGACRSAFLRGEKVLPVCLDTYCAALTPTEQTKECSDSKKVSGETPATLADIKLCKRRTRVKKKLVLEALLARRIEADLGHYLSVPQAKKYSSRVMRMVSGHLKKPILVQPSDPRLFVKLGRPLTVFVDNNGKKNIVSTGSRHWALTGLPARRVIDVMAKELKESADKQGGASQVQLFANKKVPNKLITSLIDAFRRVGMKHVVLAHEKE